MRAALGIAIFLVSMCAHALTILSEPTFTRAPNAPLAGVLNVDTDIDSRVSVSVNTGAESWQRNFFDYSTNHSEVLLGFKPDRTNQIQVTVYDKNRNAATAPRRLAFVTDPLPTNFPHSTLLESNPAKMEPGYTLFIIQYGFNENTYITVMNNAGEVVWYCPTPSIYDYDVRQLPNGDLFLEEQKPRNDFIEINMLGETVKTWQPPAGYPVNAHDGVPTDHGTILYLSDVSRQVEDFPSSATDPNAPLQTTKVDDNPVVEISATNSALINAWSPMDVLDPTRVTYASFLSTTTNGVDNEHANAVLEDPSDNSIIVSLRNQTAVYKFSRLTGQVKWILGPHENWRAAWQPYLLTQVGTPFEWNYFQHAPQITSQGTLLVYDDGIYRASPFDPPIADQDSYSRGVEFSIDETNMTVSQVWDSSLAANEDRLFTPILGNTRQLPKTGNILVTYGYITYLNGVHPSPYASRATMVRIIEYTHDPVPEVVSDLSFFDYDNTNTNYKGYVCYRANWISDLYTHPAVPVTDLAVQDVNGTPILEFSADPIKTYYVEASEDLKDWNVVGSAIQDDSIGDFSFQDSQSQPNPELFYRVVTH